MTCDLDVSLSSARFTDADLAGPLVPGALDRVVSAGVTIEGVRRMSGSVRVRDFGPCPLVEDGTVQFRGSATVNADVGRQVLRNAPIVVEAFDLLNAAVSDIDDSYASRLPGEPANGVEDVHAQHVRHVDAPDGPLVGVLMDPFHSPRVRARLLLAGLVIGLPRQDVELFERAQISRSRRSEHALVLIACYLTV
jgi:hypothetical protein